MLLSDSEREELAQLVRKFIQEQRIQTWSNANTVLRLLALSAPPLIQYNEPEQQEQPEPGKFELKF